MNENNNKTAPIDEKWRDLGLGYEVSTYGRVKKWHNDDTYSMIIDELPKDGKPIYNFDE